MKKYDNTQQKAEQLRMILIPIINIAEICQSRQNLESLQEILSKINLLLNSLAQVAEAQEEHETLRKKYELLHFVLSAKSLLANTLTNVIIDFFDSYETSYIPRIEGIFTDNLLCMGLFGDKQNFINRELKDDNNYNKLIKLLIEDGNDVIYVAHAFLLAMRSIEGGARDNLLREKFNQTMAQFFASTKVDVAESIIKSSGLDKGSYLINQYKCTINRKIPVIPVIYNARVYDLFDIALAITNKENRSTPYEFLFNGELLDSHQIQYYSNFHEKLAEALKTNLSISRSYDQLFTILWYNRSFFRRAIIYIVGYISFCYMLDAYAKQDNPSPRIVSLAQQQNDLLIMICKMSGFFMRCLDTGFNAGIDLPPNLHIRNINNFNFLYALVIAIVATTLDVYRNNDQNTKIIPVMSFNKHEYNVVFNFFGGYSICFMLYIATFLLKSTNRQPIPSIDAMPKVKVISPVFQKHEVENINKERQKQQRLLTLCFNRLAKTKQMPEGIIHQPLIEHILDMNFGESSKFRRYNYLAIN